MSSQSAPHTYTKNPYGNSAKRGRSGYLLVTVVLLMMATLIWTLTYTRVIGGRAPDAPAAATEPLQR